MEFFFTLEVIVMSFIRKPLGYKEGDLKPCHLPFFGNIGSQAEIIISVKCLTTLKDRSDG